MNRHESWRIAACAIVLVVAGCVRRGPLKTIAVFGETLSFVPDPSDPNIFIYRNPDRKTTDYEKFFVEPAQIVSDQYAGSRGIKPSQKAMLAEGFRLDLIDALRNGYDVVSSTGPGVLRIRTVIKDIHPAHWQLDEDKFVLMKFDTALESAQMQIDCLDAMSGDRVVALVHTLGANRFNEPNNERRIGSIRDAFRAWARYLRNRLDEARERVPANAAGDGHQSIQKEQGQ